MNRGGAGVDLVDAAPGDLDLSGAGIDRDQIDGVGVVVLEGQLAAAAAESIARQPSAAAQITGAVNLPLFLLEGVAILALVFIFAVVLLK